jgi:hypothetical protein
MEKKLLSAGRTMPAKQAAPHDTLGIGVLAALHATCSPTRLRPHSPVWIPCQPASFKKHCCDSPSACFRRAIARTMSGHLARGEIAMSSLRPLHADRLQIDCPRVLLTVRTTRYFIKHSVTIHAIPCVHARSQSCVCCNRPDALNRPAANCCRFRSVTLNSCGPLKPRSGVHRSLLRAG